MVKWYSVIAKEVEIIFRYKVRIKDRSTGRTCRIW